MESKRGAELGEVVSVRVPEQLRARLDAEAIRRSTESGRIVPRAVILREILQRALGERRAA